MEKAGIFEYIKKLEKAYDSESDTHTMLEHANVKILPLLHEKNFLLPSFRLFYMGKARYLVKDAISASISRYVEDIKLKDYLVFIGFISLLDNFNIEALACMLNAHLMPGNKVKYQNILSKYSIDVYESEDSPSGLDDIF